jgi:hypothetical protein
MSNYRQISLLTSFSKIFEKVIFNRIKHHIDAKNIFAQEQYGFRTKSSTEVDTYNLVGVSDWQRVKQGVPQGSILGPLLFLLYVKDLPYLINKISKPILYADDTSILCSNSDIVEHEKVLKTILDKINKWFVVNALSLNFNKTNYMHFSSVSNIKSNINANYGNIQKNSTCNIKFLGLIIDSSLSWKNNINNLYCIGNQDECGQLFYSNPSCSYESGEFKDDLFCICTFCYVIWNNILGQFDLQ